jgi:hypothetical protein
MNNVILNLAIRGHYLLLNSTRPSFRTVDPRECHVVFVVGKAVLGPVFFPSTSVFLLTYHSTDAVQSKYGARR